MILVIASMGTERIAPGIPHIQNQKANQMMTRTGLRVNRLAKIIGVIVWPPSRRKQRLPERVDGQQANEKKSQHALSDQQIDEMVDAFNTNGELQGSFGFSGGTKPTVWGQVLLPHLHRLGSRRYIMTTGWPRRIEPDF
jgi:hypothetical protein